MHYTEPGDETVDLDLFVHYKTGIRSPNNDTRDGESEKVCDYMEQGKS